MKPFRLYSYFKKLATFLLIAVCCTSCKKDYSAELKQKVRDVNTLELAEATFSKVYTIRDNNGENYDTKKPGSLTEAIGQLADKATEKLKIGQRVGVYGLKKTYSAYIDLSKLEDNDIIISGEQISLNLPKVEIKMLGDKFTPDIYFEQATLLRSKITEEERVEMRKKASKSLIDELNLDHEKNFEKLNKEAEQKAVAWLSSTLKSWGFKEVIVNFKPNYYTNSKL